MGNTLETLLEKQQRHFAALLALARKQLELLRAGGGDEALAAILADRGRLLQQVAAVDEELRAHSGDLAAADEERIRQLQELLEQVMAADAESMGLLERSKGNVVGEMESMQRGLAALKGYGGRKGSGPGRFISRKG